MAVTRTNTSRRAMLGILAAAPIVALAPAASAKASTAEWDEAWRRWRAADEEWDRQADIVERSFGSAEYKQVEAVYSKVHFKRGRAEFERFMAVPAPTLAALAIKMDAGDPGDEHHYESCLADLRRLAAREMH